MDFLRDLELIANGKVGPYSISETARAARAEIERLRYWLLKLNRDDIINDADKFAGPDEERRRDGDVEQGARE